MSQLFPKDKATVVLTNLLPGKCKRTALAHGMMGEGISYLKHTQADRSIPLKLFNLRGNNYVLYRSVTLLTT